jgi:dTDP-glucose pyrophosphorylase
MAGERSVVALVPAAGQGNRVAPLPCSKEIFPIGFRQDAASSELRFKAVSHYLLEKFRNAGSSNAFLILGKGKWDIPAMRDRRHEPRLHRRRSHFRSPDTLDHAYEFVRDQTIAFGFPDMLFGPDDVFDQLLRHLGRTGQKSPSAWYLAHDARLMDMVDLDRDGTIHAIVLKPERTNLRYAWICAAWTTKFTEYLHAFVAKLREAGNRGRNSYARFDPQGDLPVGMVFKAALDDGFRISGVPFAGERYIDIGTPADLVRAAAQLHAV